MNDPVTEIEAPIGERPVLSFREHHEKCDQFVLDCNAELRNRGFHACEAMVVVDWFGVIRFWRSEMTNMLNPQGIPQVFKVFCVLPQPWCGKVDLDVKAILNEGLEACGKKMVEMCSMAKAMRLDFSAYGRHVSGQRAPVHGKRKTALVLP
jgi:hypothetical protein